MCTVCSQLASGAEILPKALPLVDVELNEEYLLDDDSSCSISGNESPPQMRDAAAAAAAACGASEPEMSIRQRDRHSGKWTWQQSPFHTISQLTNSSFYVTDQTGKSTISKEHGQVTIRSSAPPIVHYEEPLHVATGHSRLHSHHAATSSSVPASSSSSSPITVVSAAATTAAIPTAARSKFSTLGHSLRSRLQIQLPTLTELHVLYLGIMLAIMLALFSVFLLYRILDIEAKTNLYNTPVDFNVVSSRHSYIVDIDLDCNLYLFPSSARATMRTSLRKRCVGKRSCRTRVQRKLSIFYPRILNRYPK